MNELLAHASQPRIIEVDIEVVRTVTVTVALHGDADAEIRGATLNGSAFEIDEDDRHDAIETARDKLAAEREASAEDAAASAYQSRAEGF